MTRAGGTVPPGELSAVITCHNSGPLLHRALQSVTSQTGIRVILIDDGSTACACASITDDVLHIRQPHAGQGAALNAGMDQVDTPFVAFLDDDDEWAPGKAWRQWTMLRDSTADAVVGGVVNIVDSDGEHPLTRTFTSTRVLGATTFRTEAMRRVGPFDATSRLHGIIDWWSRAEAHGLTLLEDPEPALLRTIHGGNIGVTRRDQARKDLLHQVRAHRARLRGPR